MRSADSFHGGEVPNMPDTKLADPTICPHCRRCGEHRSKHQLRTLLLCPDELERLDRDAAMLAGEGVAQPSGSENHDRDKR